MPGDRTGGGGLGRGSSANTPGGVHPLELWRRKIYPSRKQQRVQLRWRRHCENLAESNGREITEMSVKKKNFSETLVFTVGAKEA